MLGYVYTLQDEVAFKQKQREDKKKLEEAKARAGQKGPMGTSPPLMAAVINNIIMHLSKSCPTYPLPGTDRRLDRG